MSSSDDQYMSTEKRAKAKKILWSPWGDLPPRGGGGLPQGGDDDEDEKMLQNFLLSSLIHLTYESKYSLVQSRYRLLKKNRSNTASGFALRI